MMPTARELLQQVAWMGALATIHLCTISLVTPAFAADIYQYIEPDGTVSFTNVPTDARFRKVATELTRTSARAAGPGKIQEYQAERQVEEAIARHAGLQQLHPALVRAVIKAESGFDPWAVSRAGAMGLMQLMPQTALEVGVYNPYDPEDNIGGGTKYLRTLLDRFGGNLLLALAAYNAGLHRVERHRGVPPIQETREYVLKVLRFYRTFLSEKASSSSSSRTARVIPAAGVSSLVAFSTGPTP